MAEKDAAQKILEAYNDVFSDIVNVLLFNGKEIIEPDELEDQAPRAFYKADGKIREIERDVAKRWKKSNIRIACIGLENQTKTDPDMPLRVLTHEQAAMFQSDFRVVADYFVQKRENDSYVPEPCILKHVQETLQLLSVMSNDHRFEDVYNEHVKEGDIQTMCDVLDRIEERGREEGRVEGRREGTIDSIKKMVKNMKCTVNEAMDALEIPMELRDSYKKMLHS